MSNLVNIINDVNDLNANIECVPNDLFNPITNNNTVKDDNSQINLNESRSQVKFTSNLSQSHILQSRGQNSNEIPGQNSKDSWSSFSGKYKSILSSNSAVRPKEPKYKFPSVDPPPTEGLWQYSPKDLYTFLINLCYHRIPPDTYKQWCDQAQRDVAFPEMSKAGVLETTYSLKNQREQFKNP